MIRKMKKSDFTMHEFNEKTHPYVYKPVGELTGKEIWKSLVSVGKESGALASFAKWLAPEFNLLRKNISGLDRTDYCIRTQCEFTEYETLKDAAVKVLNLAKHHEVW